MALRAKRPDSSKPDKQKKKKKKGDGTFTKTDIARISGVVESRPAPQEGGKWTREDVDRLSQGLTVPGARRRLQEKAKSPSLDAARLAKNVAPAAAQTPEDVTAQKRWERNPSRMDFEGVDAPFGEATIGEPSESPADAKEKRATALREARESLRQKAKTKLAMPKLKVKRPEADEDPAATEEEAAETELDVQVEASAAVPHGSVSQETPPPTMPDASSPGAGAPPATEDLEVLDEMSAELQPQGEEANPQRTKAGPSPKGMFAIEGMDLVLHVSEFGATGKWVVRGENGTIVGVGDSRGEAEEDAAISMKALGEDIARELTGAPSRAERGRRRAAPESVEQQGWETAPAPVAQAIVDAVEAAPTREEVRSESHSTKFPDLAESKVSLKDLDTAIYRYIGANRSIKKVLEGMGRDVDGSTLVGFDEAMEAASNLSPTNQLLDTDMAAAFREAKLEMAQAAQLGTQVAPDKEVESERPGADASLGGSGVQPAERRVPEGADSDLPPGEPVEGLQTDAEGRDAGRGDSLEAEGDQEARAESDRVGDDTPGPGVELGDTREDSGRGAGLEGDPSPAESRQAPAQDAGNPAFQQLAQSPVDFGRDFILDSTKIRLPRTATERWNANINAIRLSKQLDEEGRKPTAEEQAVLAMYSGFGDSAFEHAFKGFGDQDWVRRGVELRELVSDDEFRAIERSRINAFYTTPEVIDATWKALERMGVNRIAQPRVLEPSAGSGRYLGLQPTDLAARSKRTAVELDAMTGNILKKAYPNTATFVMGFQEAPIADDSIDVAVSNVPFGNVPVFDPSYMKDKDFLTRQVHNYFFAKTLDKLRPGGVLGFVTSHFTLDAPSARPIREALAEKADFLGAIRLPEGAFPDTSVVTDVIFMQKREPGKEPGDTSWIESSTIPAKGQYGNDVEVNVNQYFQDNPDMVLGEHRATGSMYAKDSYTVKAKEGENLAVSLDRAVESLPADIISDSGSWHRQDFERGDPAELLAYANVPVGSYVIGEDDQMYVRKARGLEKAELPSKDEERVKDMLGIRDAAREVLQLQREDRDDADITEAQRKLNAEYDAFVDKNGRLNDEKNAKLMQSDPEGPFLRSLEESTKDKENAGWNKMALFNKRVVRGEPDRVVNTPSDAMAVSLDQEGHLDFEVMGAMLGQSPDAVRDALAEEKLVFKNPVGDWETADQYLSGNVREKLGTAVLATTADPSYQRNVGALTAVQPEELPASAIQVSFGAPWIPAEDYSAFVSKLLGAPRGYNYRTRKEGLFYKFSPARGSWVKSQTVRGVEGLDQGKWGTDEMAARDIIWKMLQGAPIEVKKKKTDELGNTVEYKDEKETAAALEKAEEIREEFDRWIWGDYQRAARLTELYNDKFNDSRAREYDGSHLSFPGMNVSWAQRLHQHQRDAIWRVVQDGTALLAHEVGFGKSAVMAAAGMEMRRLGMARKNVYVVPKATHEQFRRQFQELYPHAKVLFPGPKDFQRYGARPEFASRVATGDWDAVMMTYEQFKALPVKPETEAVFIRKEIDALRGAMMAEAEETGGNTPTHKMLQKEMLKLEVKLKKLFDGARDRADKTIYFEDLGIDQLFVDEADNFKNLRFATKMRRVKGLPNSESKRAWDMYMKVRHLQDKGKGRGVVFATGTPVANTIAELWTMMRYLQEPELERRGLEHFDSWARTFGTLTAGIEQSPTGKYRTAERFAKFMNVPELATLWHKTADVRVASEVPQIMERLPRLVDEKGDSQRTVVTAPSDAQLESYMVKLGQRAERLKNVDPHVDNMLKISSDARKAALDMRMVDPNANPNPKGKIPMAADNIAKIYKNEEKDKGTQLVFLDIATPKAKDNPESGDAPDDVDFDDDDLTGEEADLLKDVYNVIRNQLIAKGVAEDDIAFIHDAKTDEQRAALFEQMNNGEKRVLIGSTGKLGVGVNVQERAAAAHHLDVPWRPRDIEQREGRIIRQGNKAYGPEMDADENVIAPGKGVRIFNYVTEGSFDAYMWQAVEVKAKAIKSIMKRNIRNRTMEDADALVLSAAEAKALASGNPDVLRAVQLKNEVTRLQLLRASHRDGIAKAAKELERLPGVIQAQTTAIGRLERDVELAARTEDADFAMSVDGTSYTERTKAGEAAKSILEGMERDRAESPTRHTLGIFRGFNVHATRTDMGYQVQVSSPETGIEHISTHMDDVPAALGLVTRIENVVKSIPGRLAKTRENLQKSETSLHTYEEQANRQFEHGPKLQEIEGELKVIEERLKQASASRPADSPQDQESST